MSKHSDCCSYILMAPIIALLGFVMMYMIYTKIFPKEQPKRIYPKIYQQRSGLCDYEWQKAADGSRCGKRAKYK
ncbi:hypothetical protein ACLQ91_02430 [Avibacterium endocarditidis]|uniref:hypothetical protein n=1 Tax=Avibacterium endocarditidis TaxID=380674 RepID=UPI0039FC88AE